MHIRDNVLAFDNNFLQAGGARFVVKTNSWIFLLSELKELSGGGMKARRCGSRLVPRRTGGNVEDGAILGGVDMVSA